MSVFYSDALSPGVRVIAITAAESIQSMTRLIKAMRRPRNKLQQEQDKARESRQKVIDHLAEMMTSPNSPFTSEQLRECRAVLFYLEPEIKQVMDSLCRRYAEPKGREILRSALLATAIEAINRLLSD